MCNPLPCLLPNLAAQMGPTGPLTCFPLDWDVISDCPPSPNGLRAGPPTQLIVHQTNLACCTPHPSPTITDQPAAPQPPWIGPPITQVPTQIPHVHQLSCDCQCYPEGVDKDEESAYLAAAITPTLWPGLSLQSSGGSAVLS